MAEERREIEVSSPSDSAGAIPPKHPKRERKVTERKETSRKKGTEERLVRKDRKGKATEEGSGLADLDSQKRRKKEEREGMSLAGDSSQAISLNEIDGLIDEARRKAQHYDGSSKEGSQEFHRTVKQVLLQTLNEHPKGCQVGRLGEALEYVLKILIGDDQSKLKSTAGRKSIFPLPAPELLFNANPRIPFLQALARSLNSMHGEAELSHGNKTAVRVQKRLERVVNDSPLLAECLPEMDFKKFFEHRGVDYHGEEIQVAKRISWEAIEQSLPEQVGTLDIREFCESGVLHFINNIEDYLVPMDEQFVGKSPSVMIEDGDWERVAKALVSRGLCKVVPLKDLYHVRGKALLNGLFAVGKQEFFEGSRGKTEVCRLIMNLKPTNLISMPLEGETKTLPAITQMGGIYLADDELLSTSSEDLRCFFYLFRVPEAWHRFLGFGRAVPDSMIPQGQEGTVHVLTGTVLPMGYLNSVGIAQHIHRLVVRRCFSNLPKSVGGHQEMRRDKVSSSHENQFRVYLDNWDQLQRLDSKTAELVEGKPSELALSLREAYMAAGLPTHPKKTVQQQLGAEVQGAWIDGRRGMVSAKFSKMGKYIRLGLELLIQGKATQRELQIVGGGFVYISMFRRPLLGTLNQIWRNIVALEGKPKHCRIVLKREVMTEIARFIALMPLAYIDLRLPFDGLVTASDASTTGGGLSASQGLTPYGHAASLGSVRGELHESHDFCQILAIGLFDGIGALRVALDVLEAPLAGYISVEQSGAAQRVVEANFPDSILVSSVEEVNEAMVVSWSLRFSGVGLVLLGGGPPCQGVSGLNSDRKGVLRDARSCLFTHVPRIEQLCRAAFPWAQVHRMAENVASMDYVRLRNHE